MRAILWRSRRLRWLFGRLIALGIAIRIERGLCGTIFLPALR